MLERLDRILIAAENAEHTAGQWQVLLDAEIDRNVAVEALNSFKIVLRIGDVELEVHQPLGDGPIAEHLRNSSGPFAAGFSTRRMADLTAHLQAQSIIGVDVGEDQLYLDANSLGIPGLRVVISPYEERVSVGLLENLYECTHLTDDATVSAAAIARVFALDASQFVPIKSDTFGYDGALTLLDSSRLDRIETIHPLATQKDKSNTMGRYFNKFGPSLYMCYGEALDIDPIRERLKALAADNWTGSDNDHNGLFLHPRATSSVMLGVSRTTYAWNWSGYPDRIEPLISSD